MDLLKKEIRGKPLDENNRQSNAPPAGGSGEPGGLPVSGELQAVTDWFAKVRFRRQLIGGLDERSVWNKIRELNALYEKALHAERIRYDVLLEEYRSGCGRTGPHQYEGSSADKGHAQPAESG